MSLGNPRFTMRFSEQMVMDIEGAIKSANLRRAAVPYDRSEWVRQAVREKLSHLKRGKRPKKKRVRRSAGGTSDTNQGQPIQGAAHLTPSLV